jgi:GH25 family lysozyme M1 (1,4-beta-N-acetylmuramidase)
MTQIKGVDVSEFQGNIDFDKLKSQVDFVIIRSSYGTGFTDKKFIRNRDEARRVGLGVGFYHYAYARLNSAEAEADYFCQVVGDLRQGESLYLDWEEKYIGDHQVWSQTFLNRVTVHFNGLKSMIYLNKSLQTTHKWDSVVNAGYGLWLADYEGNGTAAPWSLMAMQQTGSTGKVDGITGNVDTDIFYGTLNAFKKYGFQPAVAPAPIPAPVDTRDQQIKDLQSLNSQKDSRILELEQVVSTKDSQINTISADLDSEKKLNEGWNMQVQQARHDADEAISKYEKEKDQELEEKLQDMNGLRELFTQIEISIENQAKLIGIEVDKSQALPMQLEELLSKIKTNVFKEFFSKFLVNVKIILSKINK